MLQKWDRALTAAFLTLLLAIFAYWILTTAAGYTAASVICAGISVLLFGLLGIRGIHGVLKSVTGAPESVLCERLGRRSLRRSYRHPITALFLTVLGVRLLVFVLAYAVSLLQKGYTGGILDTLSLWIKGDAPHYLGIADRWYVTEGDPRFHIVFFPLYPILVRLINYLIGNTFASGLFCSLVFTAGSGVLLYELTLMDYGRAAAKRAVVFLMLLPAAFLLNAPMSDGLFLLLSLGVMLLARKKRFLFACLLGGFAAFTRVLGVLLLVPVAIELWGEAVRVHKSGGQALGYSLPRAAALLLVPLGLLLYLYVNYAVTGYAFTFLIYQRDHWSQGMGWFFDTAAYQTQYLLKTWFADPPAAFGLWLPNLAFLLLAPFALLIAAGFGEKKLPRNGEHKSELKTDSEETEQAGQPPSYEPEPEPEPDAASKPEFELVTEPQTQVESERQSPKRPLMRASYTAYFLAYYVIGMGATWLLSAPRYLTCCFSLSIALAVIAQKRIIRWPLYALLFIAQIGYLWAYVAGWPVY